MTIPNVLKRGKFISGHSDHKNEGFPTYTIAAPVIINGKLGVVGAVVKKTGKYRYKAHRIILPDGTVYVFEKNKDAEPTGSDILIENNEEGPDISSASDNSIIDSVSKVNTSDENSSKKSESPNIRRSIDEESFTSPTIGNVAKSRFDAPKPKMKEKIKVGFTSAKDKLYINGRLFLYKGYEKDIFQGLSLGFELKRELLS